jgi:hypothetical protein
MSIMRLPWRLFTHALSVQATLEPLLPARLRAAPARRGRAGAIDAAKPLEGIDAAARRFEPLKPVRGAGSVAFGSPSEFKAAVVDDW